MSGTALYRALVSAGAPEDEAKEASDGIDSRFSDTFNTIDARLNRLEAAVTELQVTVAKLQVTNKLNLAVSLAILLFILKLSFA